MSTQEHPSKSYTVVQLRAIAHERGISLPAGVNKAQILDLLGDALHQAPPSDALPVPKRGRGRPRKSPLPESKAPTISSVPVQAAHEIDAQPSSTIMQDSISTAQVVWPDPDAQPSIIPPQPDSLTPIASPHPPKPYTRPVPRSVGTFVSSQRSIQRHNVPGNTVPAATRQTSDRSPASTSNWRPRREVQNGYYNEQLGTSNPAVPGFLDSSDCGDCDGYLEIQSEGYGYLRTQGYLQSTQDVYVSMAQIRRFHLRGGDRITGKTRPQREGDRFSGLIYITAVNGLPPEQALTRRPFEDLVPIYPDTRLTLERKDAQDDLAIRAIDILAPVGKGQRGMIVAPPKAGKTILLKKIAASIATNHPDVHLIVLLIDERPEEVTDMKRSIKGDVVYSTFDELPENHTRVAELVLDRAQRLVEIGKDVVILMDSITRLARAYNLTVPQSGRLLSGGLDPAALHKPKKFFGAARNIEHGGSLTILATALVETGSRMDDIIYEEFKGTGNMEIHLDRKLSEKRIFPAIDLSRSGTRREDLLLTQEEREGVINMRRLLHTSNSAEVTDQMLTMMQKSPTNLDFFTKMKGWLAVWEKEGFTTRSCRN